MGEGEEGARWGERGDTVTYLKVVGIISIECAAGDQLARQLSLRRLSVPSGFYQALPSPVTWPKKNMHRPAGLASCRIRTTRTTRTFHWPRGDASRGQERLADQTARATATDGECCRTDADARSGYQTPTPFQNRMVQTRQNYPL